MSEQFRGRERFFDRHVHWSAQSRQGEAAKACYDCVIILIFLVTRIRNRGSKGLSGIETVTRLIIATACVTSAYFVLAAGFSLCARRQRSGCSRNRCGD